jgi:hypothetical protein
LRTSIDQAAIAPAAGEPAMPTAVNGEIAAPPRAQ